VTDGTGGTGGNGSGAGGTGGLASVEHVVVLMLENRSFDHMLGFLYADAGNVSPSGQSFEGLTGKESSPDSGGQPVTVFQIGPGVTVPVSGGTSPAAGQPSHLEEIWAELQSRKVPAGEHYLPPGDAID